MGSEAFPRVWDLQTTVRGHTVSRHLKRAVGDNQSVALTLPDAVRAVLTAAEQLGASLEGVVAIGLVGSYARGSAKPTSDVDLVVLTERPELLLEADDWFSLFDPRAELIRSGDFGAIQERRLRLPHGLVVEVGVGRMTWASIKPMDPGTRRVISEGLVILFDPHARLRSLVLAING